MAPCCDEDCTHCPSYLRRRSSPARRGILADARRRLRGRLSPPSRQRSSSAAAAPVCGVSGCSCPDEGSALGRPASDDGRGTAAASSCTRAAAAEAGDDDDDAEPCGYSLRHPSKLPLPPRQRRPSTLPSSSTADSSAEIGRLKVSWSRSRRSVGKSCDVGSADAAAAVEMTSHQHAPLP